MTRRWWLMFCGMVTAGAGEMPPKAANYHEALKKRPESATLFDRFRAAWLEEMPAPALERELLERAEAGEAGAWAVLGRARLAAAKDAEALEAFTKARAASPAAWLDLEIGRLKLAAKDFPGAEREALAVPAGDKLRPEALKLAGLACLRGGRIGEAQAHWEQAVAAAPGDRSLLEDLTELTRREGRADLALDYCGKWRDAADDAYAKALAGLTMAELLESAQRHDDALAELDAVLKASGDGSWLEREVLARVEQVFRRRGDPRARAEWLAGVAAANPHRLNFLRARAEALSEAGQTAAALEVLAGVLKRSPGDRDARWQRIGLLERDVKLEQAYDECVALADEEKSAEARLRVAELAFRLDRKDAVKRALDQVMGAAEAARRPALAGLYARYGMAAEAEKQWRDAAGGKHGGQALRELARFLRTERRDAEAIAVWREIGARDAAADRMEAARELAGAGERGAARELLDDGRERFAAHPGYEEARAELALLEDRRDDALAIYRTLVQRAERPDEMTALARGWLAAAAGREEACIAALGDSPGERCLRMAWLAREGKPLPPAGDESDHLVRLTLLRENGRWAEVVEMMESRPAASPLYHRELAEAKQAAGDAAGALAGVRAWRERSPDQPTAWLKEAQLLEATGDMEGAERLLRRAVARFEDDADAARGLFSLLQKKGDTGAALDFAWLRHDRTEEAAARATWLREIIRVSREANRLEELTERFEERARRDPASPGPQRALAELARARGDYRAEMEHLRRAGEAAPRDAELIAALAAIEERNGQMQRALTRYETLAKLAPGMDSALRLAQAKIRCGQIEAGMRDLQMLAGEKGLDLREVEASVALLVRAGRMDEAIRMLEAIPREGYDARLHFLAGRIYDAAGRPQDAMESYWKVLTEPDDPAESRMVDDFGKLVRDPLMFLAREPSERAEVPGFLRQLSMPDSLAQAKSGVAGRALALALAADAEEWSRWTKRLPHLNAATQEQWRQARDHLAKQDRGHAGLWSVVTAFPENPLSRLLVRQTGTNYGGGSDELKRLLDSGKPLPLEIEIVARFHVPRPLEETVGWMKSIPATAWQDEWLVARSLDLLEGMQRHDPGEEAPPVGTWAACLDLLEGARFSEESMSRFLSLKARRDLERGDLDGFVKWADQAEAAAQAKFHPRAAGSILRRDRVVRARLEAMAPEAREALLTRLASPPLRVALLSAWDDDGGSARIQRELAALPAEAMDARRELTLRRWQTAEGDMSEELLRASTDDSHPLLALEALLFSKQGEEGFSPKDQARALRLIALLKAAGGKDADAARHYRRYENYFMAAAPVPTRWGAARPAGPVPARHQDPQSIVQGLLSLKDRALMLREAHPHLEEAMLGMARRQNMNDSLLRAMKSAGLLDEALSTFELSEHAGLGRRVAALMMFDAAGRKDRALEMAEDLHRLWPREARWRIEVALRTDDRQRCDEMLSEAAADPDFLVALMASMTTRQGPESHLPSMVKALLGWAEGRGKAADRAWTGVVARQLLGSASVWLARPQDPTTEPAALAETRALFGRLRELALARPESAEAMFRLLHTVRAALEPGDLEDAARRAMLAGAYAQGERPWWPHPALARPEAPAALEHLVQAATDSGDAAAFPPAFREALVKVDPASDAWLGELLRTDSAMDLADAKNRGAMAAGGDWTLLARHEAALLRAVGLKGRDALLDELFRSGSYGAVSRNAGHLLAASLAAAPDFRKRLEELLEAAAGPRKSWAEADAKTRQALDGALQHLRRDLMSSQDSALLVGLTTALTDWRLGARYQESDGALAQAWSADLANLRYASLGELPGWSTLDTLKLGHWQTAGHPGKPVFRYSWSAPGFAMRFAQTPQGNAQVELYKGGKGDSPPPLLYLLVVAGKGGEMSGHALEQALRTVAPELSKVAPEIREAVVTALARNLAEEPLQGMPEEILRILQKQADEQKAARLAAAVAFREEIQTEPKSAHQVGQMIASIIAYDRPLADEIVSQWLEAAGRKKEDRLNADELETFLAGALAGRQMKGSAPFEILRLAERLGLGQVALRGGTRPYQTAWQSLGDHAANRAATWSELARLQGPLLGRMLAAMRFEARAPIDAAQREALRKAAAGNPLTRAACAWFLALNPAEQADKQVPAQAAADWLGALKSAGTPPDVMAAIISSTMGLVSRMEDAGPFLTAVAECLEDVKAPSKHELSAVLSGLLSSGRDIRDADRRLSRRYPAEAGRVLRWWMQHGNPPASSEYQARQASRMVLSLEDPELVGLWAKAAAATIVGDVDFIHHFLKQGKVEDAIALVPPPDRPWYRSAQPFTRETERWVASLAALPGTAAFRLQVHLALRSNASGDEAPAGQLSERQARLITEFGTRADTMSRDERRTLCAALGLPDLAAREPVPLLDGFLGDDPQAEFVRIFTAKQGHGMEREEHIDVLVGAACSAFHSDDPRGVDAIAAALELQAAGGMENSIGHLAGPSLARLRSTIWIHADRHDGRMPEDAAKAVRRLVAALRKFHGGTLVMDARLWIALASNDAADFERNLKDAGVAEFRRHHNSLAGMDGHRGGMQHPAPALAKLRLSVLHPVVSKELEVAMFPRHDLMMMPGGALPLLADEKVRAALPPERFVEWIRWSRMGATPEHMRDATTYATDRRADFTDDQWKAWEAMRDRPLPPARGIRPEMDPRRGGRPGNEPRQR